MEGGSQSRDYLCRMLSRSPGQRRGEGDSRGLEVMFTGSTNTGNANMRSAEETMERPTLELGGDDAGIALPDADPEAIAEGVSWGAFTHTGQTCAALKRLHVHKSQYEQMCRALVEVAKRMPMGVGVDEQNVLGPLQNKAQSDIVAGLVEEARQPGATISIGGDPEANQPEIISPTTLVAELDDDHPQVAEEQFGPVLPIVKCTDLDQAIEWADGLDVGQGSSVWGWDVERAREVPTRLRVGATWITMHGAVDPRMLSRGPCTAAFSHRDCRRPA